MTVMAERTPSQMSVDVFDRIAEFAERVDDTVRLYPWALRGAGGLGRYPWGAEGRGDHLVRLGHPQPGPGRETPRLAEAGIPVCLLIDRDNLPVLVHSDPDPEDGYGTCTW